MSNTTISSEILGLRLASRMIFSYAVLVLITSGTVGNLLNILVFIRIRVLRQMPNSIFLLTSFVASLVQLWTTRFSTVFLNLTGVDLLKQSGFYCEIRWLFGRMSGTITMASICLVSINRFLMTSHNVRYRQVFTTQRARVAVIVVVLVFFIPFTPDIVYYWTPSCTSTGSPYGYRQFIMYFSQVFSNLVAGPVLALFGILTWRNLRGVRVVQRNRLEEQVNRMILAELVMVCITAIPSIITVIYPLVTASMSKSQLRVAQDGLWLNILAIPTITTYCVSFYVFYAVSSAYRKNVRTALNCKKHNRIETQNRTLQQNT
ncbi:unnamed protein product [Adineta steineri]|uniref:G-protein coupled receptors family 1 profile domain-containing protein n=1 Tax=Adineta steineri TaxID=433720 RepID=A0A819IYT8_9BILA|nr:unnamed protein product [Adineta steineri]CAF0906070.1 unnamed protein product [Adineta steineri]CAF3924796.1 unnamed protein product [Adineta steineri]CAF3945176.1 unnamed protein product [Adineta steineri]